MAEPPGFASVGVSADHRPAMECCANCIWQALRGDVLVRMPPMPRDRLGEGASRATVLKPSLADWTSCSFTSDNERKTRSVVRLRRAGDRGRTGDVQLGKLAFYH